MIQGQSPSGTVPVLSGAKRPSFFPILLVSQFYPPETLLTNFAMHKNMDISKLFKSKTRKELFRLYFTNPGSEYYLRELERLLDIPVSMIRQEIVRLEEEGIFNSHRKGNLVYFSLNKSYPLFDELKSIIFKTIGVKGLIKQSLEKIKGIEAAFIYGSFAKNEEKATSDIDLCLVGAITKIIFSER
jgi:hypothetical protein